jgi:hypothetical protein
MSTDGGATFLDIAGANSAILTLSSVTADMNGEEFHAVFTNSLGVTTTTAAILAVH